MIRSFYLRNDDDSCHNIKGKGVNQVQKGSILSLVSIAPVVINQTNVSFYFVVSDPSKQRRHLRPKPGETAATTAVIKQNNNIFNHRQPSKYLVSSVCRVQTSNYVSSIQTLVSCSVWVW